MSTPASLVQHDRAAAALARVRETAEGVFEALREVRDAAVACVLPAGGTRRPVVADLAALRPLLWARLRGGALPAHLPALIAGIGFIAAPGLLADAPWYLEWWQENPSGDPVQLLRNMDPASSAFYDYTHWDWYAGPFSGAERTICGPYVDYLCTDEYSLTLSVPVRPGGASAGVAAAGRVRPAVRGRGAPGAAGDPGPGVPGQRGGPGRRVQHRELGRGIGLPGWPARRRPRRTPGGRPAAVAGDHDGRQSRVTAAVTAG
ncbi:cache domain-containing protein [Microbispora sp. GKU 823]|uniref:cache domain-containing protein n=1 Tax=Microbispora sp. GKU 823 TaxID=1652100 RepID=UPI0011815666|nr:cache domain-containing protein [Microbispora sp. GKU 823]